MVKKAENGLEEEGGDDRETDYGVVLVDLYAINEPSPTAKSSVSCGGYQRWFSKFC